jgi:ssDNA-binding replication factor A large subunit
LFGGSGGMTAQGTNDDVQLIEFTISRLTLDEIDGQCFGIRALSVGETEEYRTDSVKLLGTFDVTDDGGILS